MIKGLFLILTILLVLSGCSEKEDKKSSAPAMKCGAGKCGANMFDGNSALTKKKRNILSQMRDNDSRKDCVKKAATTKELYNCVRDPDGHKLIMKCGSAKCGTEMKKPAMKCGEGKCGSSM